MAGRATTGRRSRPEGPGEGPGGAEGRAPSVGFGTGGAEARCGARGAEPRAPGGAPAQATTPWASRSDPARAGRASRGRTAHHAGRAAEGTVARHYARAGLPTIEARWRGRAGEIDLVLRDGEGPDAGLVFVEVKASRDHARAARSLTPRQVARLLEAGAEYLGTQPLGQLTPARFDVALVDRSGRVEIIENALGQ